MAYHECLANSRQQQYQLLPVSTVKDSTDGLGTSEDESNGHSEG